MYLCVKIYFVRKFPYEVGGKFSSIMTELFFIFMFCLKKKKMMMTKVMLRKGWMNEWTRRIALSYLIISFFNFFSPLASGLLPFIAFFFLLFLFVSTVRLTMIEEKEEEENYWWPPPSLFPLPPVLLLLSAATPPPPFLYIHTYVFFKYKIRKTPRMLPWTSPSFFVHIPHSYCGVNESIKKLKKSVRS